MRICVQRVVVARRRLLGLLLLGCAACHTVPAQHGVGWLRYAIPPDPPRYHGLPHVVVMLGDAAGNIQPEEQTAAEELDRGLGHMVAGTDVVLRHFDLAQDAIILGTTDALHRARLGRHLRGWTEKPLPEEGFRIVHLRRGIREWYVLQGGSPRAVLWAAFRFAALVAEDQQLPENYTDAPQLSQRLLDLRGTGDLLPLLSGTQPNGGLLRLLASAGINGLVTEAHTAEIAEAARPYGIRVWLRGAVPPAELQRLQSVPNLGGIVIPMPADTTAGNFHSAAAVNALAQQLRRNGGTVLLADALGTPLQSAARSPADMQAADRANFLRMAGLEPNVILSSAALPADQPLAGIASPDFSQFAGSPQLASFTLLDPRLPGLAYPAPAWADALQTPERDRGHDTTLAALLSQHGSGAAGILSTAEAAHMLAEPLLQANLYAFGRLLWSPTMSVAAITEEWSRQTWGDDERAHAISTHVLLASTAAARDNTSPLGLPLLATGTGAPTPQRAAELQVAGEPLMTSSHAGTDRSMGENSIAGRYPAAFAAELANPAHCPPPWLLLFHRLPYTYALPDGKTLVQSLYNAHFTGAAQADNALDLWQTTAGLVDVERFTAVQTFLARAAVHAQLWRERATEWLQTTSGIPDALGFVGSHPGRILPAAMQLDGYMPARRDGSPPRDELVCHAVNCTAALRFQGTANVYRVEIGYADAHRGTAWQLLVNGVEQARWKDSATRAAHAEDPTSGTLPLEDERFVVNGVRIKPGDTVQVRAVPIGPEAAPLGFVEITRDPRWN